MTYAEQKRQIDLEIQDGIITVSKDIKKDNVQELKNLNLTFRASVIQNDGSLTPAAAWDRLK